ncbi:MAG: hypothetical protein JSR21_12555 [Proteobacteria bacterium]|nr:hypothetical protein [Pseudomonadota bacterium]
MPVTIRLTSPGSSNRRRVAVALTVEQVFGTDLPRALRFVAALTNAYALLLAMGARAAAASA